MIDLDSPVSVGICYDDKSMCLNRPGKGPESLIRKRSPYSKFQFSGYTKGVSKFPRVLVVDIF